MIESAHHIGIAVQSIDVALPRFLALGLRLESREDLPANGVRVAFLSAGGVRLELVEPLDPHGTVARFLASRGEGLHHVAFETADIVAELARLEAEGFELIDRVPRPGSRKHQIAFVHPRSAHGVLIELVQEAP